jgi:biotin transport system substrate-specific component
MVNMTRSHLPAHAVKSFRPVVTLTELLWALIGLLLTIGGTLLKASIISFPWLWSAQGVPLHFLGVSYQIGAVLLVSCLGGKNAGIISQIAYLALGIAGFPVFTKGSALDYLREPSFGYLLGFLPGAWVCGYLAFKYPPRLESLALSSLCGLLCVHATGISYLLLTHGLKWSHANAYPLKQALLIYSLHLIPGQLAVVCAVTVLAYALRLIMFY